MTMSRQTMTAWINVATPVRTSIGGKAKKIRTKIAPAINSTSGYCHEILLRHFLQAPFWRAKLKSGMSSFHVSVVPQDMHFDLPPSPIPVLKRSATTFKKLPTTTPKMKVRMSERMSMMD